MCLTNDRLRTSALGAGDDARLGSEVLAGAGHGASWRFHPVTLPMTRGGTWSVVDARARLHTAPNSLFKVHTTSPAARAPTDAPRCREARPRTRSGDTTGPARGHDTPGPHEPARAAAPRPPDPARRDGRRSSDQGGRSSVRHAPTPSPTRRPDLHPQLRRATNSCKLSS